MFFIDYQKFLTSGVPLNIGKIIRFKSIAKPTAAINGEEELRFKIELEISPIQSIIGKRYRAIISFESIS